MGLSKGVKTALKIIAGLLAAAALLVVAIAVYFIFFYKSYLDDPAVYFPATDSDVSANFCYYDVNETAELSDSLPSYTAGQFGPVVLGDLDMLDAVTEEDKERFLSHWHDRSWSCDVELPSRYVTAHYENDPNTIFTAGEALVAFDGDTSDDRIGEVASSCSAHVGSISKFPVNGGQRCVALLYWDDLTIDSLAKAKEVVAAFSEVEFAFPNIMGSASEDKQAI